MMCWHRALAALITVITVIGCEGGLRRTGTDQWSSRSFRELSATASISRDAQVDVFDSAVLVQFHPVSPPFGARRDTHYLITIDIERMDVRDFNDMQMDMRGNPPTDPELAEWAVWRAELHQEISAKGDGARVYYRRDVLCDDKEMLSIEAEVLVDPTNAEGDDDAVRQVLTSIRCSTRNV